MRLLPVKGLGKRDGKQAPPTSRQEQRPIETINNEPNKTLGNPNKDLLILSVQLTVLCNQWLDQCIRLYVLYHYTRFNQTQQHLFP